MGLVMALDFQQVRIQVNDMGEGAPKRFQELRRKRNDVVRILEKNADRISVLQDKVIDAVGANPNLRCASPTSETLNHQSNTPQLPELVTLLAADGSQINPNRHSSLDYCLVNVGAIKMVLGSPDPPETEVRTRLLFDDEMYTDSGRITESYVALMRDLRERELLAELTQGIDQHVITLTDGPIEIWESRDNTTDSKEFNKRFEEFLGSLRQLQQNGASTAGYIDRPHSDLVVRLLEIATLPIDQIHKAGRGFRPFLGVTDADLFSQSLKPGQRSALFRIQSRNSKKYEDDLALHFFYLNVGDKDGQNNLVRVEMPAWVAENVSMLDDLHSVLVQQCTVLGTRRYPYIIHRSHEVAVVTRDERKQVERMIALELYRRGLSVGEVSHKQAAKDLPGRTRI